MTPGEIRSLAGLLEAFATNDADHCGGTEHRVQSANVMRALAGVMEAAHRYVHTDTGSLELEETIARVEALRL